MGADVALLVLGLGLLIGAGDVLVRGAVAASLRLRLPALVVSLVIVSAGTTAPELVISVRAVADGLPGLALGNVIGSNIANALLVIGLPALIAGLAEPDPESRRGYLRLLGAAALFSLCMLAGRVGAGAAMLLLAALALLLADTVRHALRQRTGPETMPAAAGDGGEDDPAGGDRPPPGWRVAAMLVAGIAGLALGADLLVGAAERIATAMGVAPAVIGLTIVALGTSLPELATAVTAGLKGRGDVALGNVIGANIYNLLGITAAAALAGDLTVPGRITAIDLWVMLAALAALAPLALFGRPLGRLAGLALTGGYLIYVVALIG